MKVIDPGHRYELDSLDGRHLQILQFVKRNNPPEKYPGNTDAYPGTTTQDVIRCLLERARYVQAQQPCDETALVIWLLRRALFHLESRAKRVKGKVLTAKQDEVEAAETCKVCGHVFCSENHSS